MHQAGNVSGREDGAGQSCFPTLPSCTSALRSSLFVLLARLSPTISSDELEHACPCLSACSRPVRRSFAGLSLVTCLSM